MKNLSLIHRKGKIELSPVYDLVNSTILIRTNEEMALPICGKKSRLKRTELIDSYGHDRLGLPMEVIDSMLSRFREALPAWHELIGSSFLPEDAKKRYESLVNERASRLEL